MECSIHYYNLFVTAININIKKIIIIMNKISIQWLNKVNSQLWK